jgi:hypothetical protein
MAEPVKEERTVEVFAPSHMARGFEFFVEVGNNASSKIRVPDGGVVAGRRFNAVIVSETKGMVRTMCLRDAGAMICAIVAPWDFAIHSIPGGCCDDCCCSLFCMQCSICQLSRHTADYKTYPAGCCTDNGLSPSAPDVVYSEPNAVCYVEVRCSVHIVTSLQLGTAVDILHWNPSGYLCNACKIDR